MCTSNNAFYFRLLELSSLLFMLLQLSLQRLSTKISRLFECLALLLRKQIIPTNIKPHLSNLILVVRRLIQSQCYLRLNNAIVVARQFTKLVFNEIEELFVGIEMHRLNVNFHSVLFWFIELLHQSSNRQER